MMARRYRTARLALVLASVCAACTDKTEEPPAGVFAPVSGASSSPPAAASAVVTLPPSSSDVVPVPPTVRGILPAGFADKVSPDGAPLRVAVITPGAEPRQALRYAYKVGARRSAVLLIHPEFTREDANAPEMNLPDLAFRITLTVGARDASGARIDGRFEDIRVASDPPPGADRRPVDNALAPIKNLTLVLSVDDHGRVRSFEASGGDPSDPGPRQLVEQMKTGIGSLFVPLPDEPIGLGATWQCVSRVKGRAELLQFTTHKLGSLASGVFDVESRADLFAVDDRIDTPMGPAKVGEFSGSATGATRSALDEVGARSGQWDIRSSIAVGSGFKMSSKIHFEIAP